MMTKPFKFGCLPTKHDSRNLKMATLLKGAPDIGDGGLPKEWDFDLQYPDVTLPCPMWGNDKHGCCVIAATGYKILRDDYIETGLVPNITERQVLAQWWLENGSTDNGLVILDHLNRWRQEGVNLAGHQYQILAFAQIDPLNHDEVRETMRRDVGIMTGIPLPDSALTEFQNDNPWADTTEFYDWNNGHCVYFTGYDETYTHATTWARRKQNATWDWWDKYVGAGEAYGVIDAKNTWGINQAALDQFLAALGD